METIADYNGELCIASTDNDYFEPIKRTLYYPIGVKSRDYPQHIGARVQPLGNGLYTLYEGYSPLKFRLINGGQTIPIGHLDEPIPCPTTRVETRYVRGHWEKYLKNDGWVYA